jgi:hypothetical protein
VCRAHFSVGRFAMRTRIGGSGLAKNVPVSTWHRSVRGSMPSSLQDAISEYIAAARSPPLLDLAKSGAARAIKLN